VVTDSFKSNLISRGIAPEKIFVVKNGVDLSFFRPQVGNAKLIHQLGLHDKFVIGYVGTHGLAHSLDFIVRSISKIDDTKFHFIFIGEGAEKKNILALAASLNINNASFIDPVKKSDINEYLALMKVALVPLRKSTTFESVIPSKIFESVAMNIPILLGVNGETRSIIESYEAGFYFEPENEKDFIEKAKMMKAKMESDPSFFSAGCKKMSHDFDRKNLAKEMLEILSTN
jgi:glycosyltransferase involved in cell wall biosynthesis